MKNIFFTGANGFLGTHLITFIKKEFPDVYIHNYSGAIEDFHLLKKEFELKSWDYIFHFAGMSHVVNCENNPQKAYEVNTLGSIFLSQLIINANFKGKLYFTSTAQVYKPVLDSESKIEFNESSIICPQNTYARTKLFSESVFEKMSQISDSQVYILRLFNHTHKSQSTQFLLPSVFSQIQNAQDGGAIKVGNLDLERDFSLIPDFLNFFKSQFVSKNFEKFKIVNLSSGQARNLRSIVELFIKKSQKRISITVDPSLFRKNDPKKIVGKFDSSYNNNLTDEEFVELFINS